jgi:hypothetical protein
MGFRALFDIGYCGLQIFGDIGSYCLIGVSASGPRVAITG